MKTLWIQMACAATAVACGLAACGGGNSPPPQAVASVAIAPVSVTLTVGGTQQLTAKAEDASGNVVSGGSMTWQSTDATVATVSPTGLVSALAGGSAGITASVDGVAGTAAVSVTAGAPNPLQLAMFAAIVAEATIPAGASVTIPAPTMTDSAGTPAVNCTPAIGTGTLPIGTTVVTCAATDAAGNRASGASTVTVVDTTAPTLTMFAPITVVATGPSGAVVTVPAPMSSDVASTPIVTCSPAVGPSEFPLGTTTVTCTARDPAGNVTTKTSTITVLAAGFTVGGSVSGLVGSGLVLQNNGAADLAIAANGAFTFAAPVASGASYNVTVKAQPSAPSQTCTVGNGSGTGASANVANVSVSCVTAASGTLDPTFGTGGTFMVAPGEARGVVIQSDGKIVIAALGPYANGNSFTLLRFNADGSADTSFGLGGKAVGNFGGQNLASEEVMALVLLGDGNLVVGGWGTLLLNGQSSTQFALARFDASGNLDTSFGTAGKAYASFGNRQSLMWSLAIQSDGKLVAAGGTYQSATANYDFALARFLSNGSPDATFGNGGTVVTDVQGSRTDDTAQSVALQSDGKIVVAGWTQLSNGDQPIALARYDADGSLDATFGNGGRTWSTSIVIGSGRARLALQSDGRMLVSSTAPANAEDFALSRFNSDASVDTAFGTNGTVTTDFNGGTQERAMTLMVQGDGKVIVAGFSYLGQSGDQFALARYRPDGSLDANFGSGGKVVTDFGGGLSLVNALAIQADGKIVAVGVTSNNTVSAALARYIP
jgi:uncharacterized delta-60 repeat protein